MGVDFEGNLSWKGATVKINWYSHLIDNIHDYIWEEDNESD